MEKTARKKGFRCWLKVSFVYMLIILSVVPDTRVFGETEEYGEWNSDSGHIQNGDELSVVQDNTDAEDVWNHDNAVNISEGSYGGDFSSGENIRESGNSHQTGSGKNSYPPNKQPQNETGNERESLSGQEMSVPDISKVPTVTKAPAVTNAPTVTPAEKKTVQKKNIENIESNKKRDKTILKRKVIPEVKMISREVIPEVRMISRKLMTPKCTNIEIQLNSQATIAVASVTADDKEMKWHQEGNRIILRFSEHKVQRIKLAILCRKDFAWTKSQKNAILSYNTF